MVDEVLRSQDLKGYYRGSFGVVYAVDGVSLSVNKGEILGLAGESGCGKTTFLKLLTGTPFPLLHYEGGKVVIEGYDIWSLPEEVVRKEVKCKLLSYVPQSSLNALNPILRLKQFVAKMLKERTGRKYSSDEARDMLTVHFNNLGLEKHVLDLYPHELSGGMRQRAVIAISTYAQPSLLLTDEPTSSLDVSSQKRMVKMLMDIHRRGLIKSMIVSSHDLGMLRQLCHRIAIMYAGKMVEVGETEDIIKQPLHPYTKLLLDTLLPLERWTKQKVLKSIPGRPPDLRNPSPVCSFHPRCPERTSVCRPKEPPLIEENGRLVSCWLYRGELPDEKRRRHLES
jgi:peptide/nickel transport system ATP-binding protein